jgi:hypothetical protein
MTFDQFVDVYGEENAHIWHEVNGEQGVAEGSDDIKTLQIDLWNLYKDVTGNRPRADVVDWTREQWNDPEFLKGEIAKLSQQGMAEATGDEPFDKMMGKITGGADARQGVDSLNKSLTARTGSNPETALAKWGQEFIKWLEDICRNFAKQGADRISKLENLGNLDDGGETMAHWLIEVAKKTNTSGITLADIQEFSSEFNTHGMWAWQHFPIAWSQSEWQDYKDQWTGPDGYIASLGQGVAEDWKSAVAGGAMALGALGGAHAGGVSLPGSGGNFEPSAQQTLNQRVQAMKDAEAASSPKRDLSGFATSYLQKAMNPGGARFLISPEEAKVELAARANAEPMKEDAYMESLGAMLERQLEPTMDLDTWNNNFQNADPQKYHQFKNKTPEKKK